MKDRTAQLRLVHTTSPVSEDDPLDFDAIFLRYSPYAAVIAARIMGNEDDVDDIVQDVFIDVHKGLSTLKSALHVKGWVATITVRVCAKRLRLRKLHRFLMPAWSSLSEQEAYEIPQKGLAPDEQLWLKHIYAVLDTMAIPLRVAWTLRYLQEEKLEQVAKLCGCSLATAKRRIFKAHQMIRSVVDQDGAL